MSSVPGQPGPAETKQGSADAKPLAQSLPRVVRYGLIASVVFAGCLLWSYWTTLSQMASRWSTDPQYSHGYLVPIFAAALLWLRRRKLDVAKIQPSWWGIPLLAGALVLRLLGTYFFFDWFDQISFLLAVGGIGVLVGGPAVLRWAWPAVGFLYFMIPMPYRVEISLAHPLQRVATISSTYCMQTIGLPAIGEGNVILVEEARIGVVEACSGLRMLVVFFAISTAVALLSTRPLWERALIVVSAIPIALISNIIRITVTGILHGTGHSDLADRFFHDIAGWVMMPMALGFLWAELWLLSHLLIEVKPTGPMRIGPEKGTPRRKNEGTSSQSLGGGEPRLSENPA